MNAREIQTAAGREAVRQKMFEDGLGEEAIEHAAAYAKEITGRASRTAVAHVQRHIRSICRGDWKAQS